VDNIQEKIDIITRKPSKEPNDGYSASLKADIVGLFTNRDFPLTKRRRPFELKFNGPDLGGSRYAEGPGKNSSCLPALIPSLELPQWVYDDVPNLRDWVRSHPYFKKIHYMSKLFGNGVKERGPYWAGNLAFLSEPGLKTRVVFVGNPWIQGALRSSMVILQRELLKLSTDCTFDQDRGRSFLREGLSEGKTMHSIDLSQATDNFPFSLQEYVGSIVGLPQWSLDLLGKAGFHHPTKGGKEILHYGTGQPMGLYPSFALFALTHNVILHTLSRRVGVTDSFRVLGDDVIISDSKLFTEYREFLREYSIPVSWSKSFSSSNLGEFGGIISWKGYNITPIKWRPVTNRSIDVISQYIDRGMIVVDHDSQRIVTIPLADKSVYTHAEALYPLPKEVGGFGQLTRKSLTVRLHWGRRNVRSLRSGYLAQVGERLNRFLGPQDMTNIDITKFAGLRDQQLGFESIIENARRIALTRPPGGPMPMPMGAPSGSVEEIIPSDREGLKGLESLISSKDSLEERLGKYHFWCIAKLGPNPTREFNRMMTISGQLSGSLDVPIVTFGRPKIELHARTLPPRFLENLFEAAVERIEQLRQVREGIQRKPEVFDQGLPIGKLFATGATFLVNPVAGLLVGGLALLSESQEDKPQNLEKLIPVLMK
jgi:hypothetical protein